MSSMGGLREMWAVLWWRRQMWGAHNGPRDASSA